MTDHMDIFEYCILYVACFTALLSLTPLGTFPPRDIIFGTPAISLGGTQIVGASSFDISWTTFISVLATTGVVLIILLNTFSNVSFSVFGIGVSWSFDAKYIGTLMVGVVVSAGLGISMQQMLPSDVPLLVAFFLVWIWCALLIYSIFMYAGAPTK